MQHMQLVKDDATQAVTLRDPIIIHGSTLTFTCKEERCRAIAILASKGMPGVASQLFSKDLDLEFQDAETALSVVDTYLNRGRELSESLLKALFDESIEDSHGEYVFLCGFEFKTASVLLKVDPVIYQELFVEWLTYMLDEERFIEVNGKYFENARAASRYNEEE